MANDYDLIRFFVFLLLYVEIKRWNLRKIGLNLGFLMCLFEFFFFFDIVNVFDSIFILMKMLYYRMEEKGNIFL